MNRRNILKSIGAGGLFALGVGSAGATTNDSVEQAGNDGSGLRVKLSDGRVLAIDSSGDCDCILDDCSEQCPDCCDVCAC